MSEIKTKEYTVKEVFEALKKNGFSFTRGEYIYKSAKAISACALGQAGLNLSCLVSEEIIDNPYMAPPELEKAFLIKKYRSFTIEGQLNKWKYRNKKWRRTDHGYLGLGAVIIYWNDKFDETTGEWVLRTYEDVANMAEEVLRPHFDKVVTLIEFEY